MSSIQKKAKIKFVDHDKRLFFTTLKNRVDQYFKERGRSSHANAKMVIKTIVLLLIYLLPFVIIVLVPMPFIVTVLLWLIMGMGVAGVGMSVMHDANHGAYSKYAAVNSLVGFSLNLLGASIHNW